MVNLFYMNVILNSSIEYELVKKNVSHLKKITHQSQALCMAAVQINPKAILYMHANYEDVFVQAVLQCGDLLKDVKYQTALICLTAVKNEGLALKYVVQQNEEICFSAVQNNGFAIKYVSK